MSNRGQRSELFRRASFTATNTFNGTSPRAETNDVPSFSASV
jgi:hypothetical protein